MKYLRIKKKWLVAIENGEKTIEYRSHIKFYEWLNEATVPFNICFHYQTDHKIIKTAYKIKLITTPKWIDKTIISTNKCWAIYLM